MSDGPTFEELLARPSWMRDSLCCEPSYAGVDFFPGKGESLGPAKAVCARCLCREDCLAYALAHDIDHGVWAGLSPGARKRLRRARAA